MGLIGLIRLIGPFIPYFSLFPFHFFLFWRHWVVSAASPGVASQYAPDSQEQAFDGAVNDEGLSGIFRAGGCEATGRRRVGRYEALVEHDRQQQAACQKPCNSF